MPKRFGFLALTPDRFDCRGFPMGQKGRLVFCCWLIAKLLCFRHNQMRLKHFFRINKGLDRPSSAWNPQRFSGQWCKPRIPSGLKDGRLWLARQLEWIFNEQTPQNAALEGLKGPSLPPRKTHFEKPPPPKKKGTLPTWSSFNHLAFLHLCPLAKLAMCPGPAATNNWLWQVPHGKSDQFQTKKVFSKPKTPYQYTATQRSRLLTPLLLASRVPPPCLAASWACGTSLSSSSARKAPLAVRNFLAAKPTEAKKPTAPEAPGAKSWKLGFLCFVEGLWCLLCCAFLWILWEKTALSGVVLLIP